MDEREEFEKWWSSLLVNQPTHLLDGRDLTYQGIPQGAWRFMWSNCFNAATAKQVEKISELEEQLSELRLAYGELKQMYKTACKEIAQLKAQGEQELVAWREFDGEGDYHYRTYSGNEGFKESYLNRNGHKYKDWVEPLYTAPPLREGWVMVPREPSVKMLQVLAREWHPDKYAYMADRYKAMIAASEEEK